MTPINIDRIVAHADENRGAGLKNMTIDCDDARALCRAVKAAMELRALSKMPVADDPITREAEILDRLDTALLPFGRE